MDQKYKHRSVSVQHMTRPFPQSTQVRGKDRIVYSLSNRISIHVALVWIVTHAHCNRGSRTFTSVCLCVCFFPARYLKNRSRNTKLDIEMGPDGSWKSIYLASKGQGNESQTHCRCGSLHSCECWLLPFFLGHERDCTSRTAVESVTGI